MKGLAYSDLIHSSWWKALRFEVADGKIEKSKLRLWRSLRVSDDVRLCAWKAEVLQMKHFADLATSDRKLSGMKRPCGNLEEALQQQLSRRLALV